MFWTIIGAFVAYELLKDISGLGVKLLDGLAESRRIQREEREEVTQA
jgi:hypothetical protein